MTNREREVYELISQNPMISQEEISEKLKIARSSVAVHISNLMKKGHILGKGYVLKKSPYILVIGGANIDIEGYPVGGFKMKDSNPGIIKRSFGGVARNIAENLAVLGVDTKLITLVGEDSSGRELLDYCQKKGIDVSCSEVVEGKSTSTYLSILGAEKDMEVAISHMNIMECLDKKFILKRQNLIRGAAACIVDTNIPEETIDFLLKNYDIPFIIDTVSLEKSRKIHGLYDKIDVLKPNLLEAEFISGVKIKNEEDVVKAGEEILNLGVKNIFISLGREGVYYASSEEKGFLRPPKVDVVSSTGAGDAFLSGTVAGKMLGKSLKEQAMYGIAGSICSLRSEKTIPENLNIKRIEEILEEVKKCNFMKNI